MYYIYKLEVMPLQDNKDIQYRGIEEANVLKKKKSLSIFSINRLIVMQHDENPHGENTEPHGSLQTPHLIYVIYCHGN